MIYLFIYFANDSGSLLLPIHSLHAFYNTLWALKNTDAAEIM